MKIDYINGEVIITMIDKKKLSKLGEKYGFYGHEMPQWYDKRLEGYVEWDRYGLRRKVGIEIPEELYKIYKYYKKLRIEEIIIKFYKIYHGSLVYDKKNKEFYYYTDIYTEPTEDEKIEMQKLIEMS